MRLYMPVPGEWLCPDITIHRLIVARRNLRSPPTSPSGLLKVCSCSSIENGASLNTLHNWANQLVHISSEVLWMRPLSSVGGALGKSGTDVCGMLSHPVLFPTAPMHSRTSMLAESRSLLSRTPSLSYHCTKTHRTIRLIDTPGFDDIIRIWNRPPRHWNEWSPPCGLILYFHPS